MRIRLDHTFDHLRIRTVWKQCLQEHPKASFSDTKAPKSPRNQGKNYHLTLRELETVGSSPAASTKKTVFLTVFFHFVEVGEGENPPRALCIACTTLTADFCSHYLRARIGFAFQVKPWGARSPKASDRNIHLSVKIPLFFSGIIRLSPQGVLQRITSIVCYSAVRMRRMTQYTASGMRLRQLLCPPTFILLGRVPINSYQPFMPRLPVTSTKKQPKTSHF